MRRIADIRDFKAGRIRVVKVREVPRQILLRLGGKNLSHILLAHTDFPTLINKSYLYTSDTFTIAMSMSLGILTKTGSRFGYALVHLNRFQDHFQTSARDSLHTITSKRRQFLTAGIHVYPHMTSLPSPL